MSEQSDREIERAFQMLECCGVPRERAKTVSNGIDVLSTRCRKEANGLAYDIATLKAHRDELLAVMKKIKERGTYTTMACRTLDDQQIPAEKRRNWYAEIASTAIANAEKDKPGC